jgi:hypothetical protein
MQYAGQATEFGSKLIHFFNFRFRKPCRCNGAYLLIKQFSMIENMYYQSSKKFQYIFFLFKTHRVYIVEIV